MITLLLLLDCLYFYLPSASREEAGSHWANYATCQEQRAGSLSLLPAVQSGYTTQNREAHGNNAVALVSRANSSHSMPHHLHSAGGTGANKSLTGFGGGTMCSPGDVYRIYWGSEIAHWKNLSVGHQACLLSLGREPQRASCSTRQAARRGFKGCLCVCACCTYLTGQAGGSREETGSGQVQRAGQRAPAHCLATCPSRAG